MIDYEQFLLERLKLWKGTTKLQIDEAKEMIEKFCNDDPNTTIVRSLRNREIMNEIEYMLVDPTKVKRNSADGKNTYTLLLDNLSSWKNFPKRSNSLICHLTKREPSSDEINLYKVYPYKNSVWGVCSYADIWWSFTKLREQNFKITSFNRIMNNFYSTLNNDKELDDSNYDILSEQLNSLKSELPKLFVGYYAKPSQLYQETMDEIDFWKNLILGAKGTVIEELNKMFEPYSNGFKLVKYEDLKNLEIDRGLEIWTDSTAILKNVTDKEYRK